MYAFTALMVLLLNLKHRSVENVWKHDALVMSLGASFTRFYPSVFIVFRRTRRPEIANHKNHFVRLVLPEDMYINIISFRKCENDPNGIRILESEEMALEMTYTLKFI